MKVSFKPSDIYLSHSHPLIDTFGRVELEMAATWIVFGLAKTSDRWEPITLEELKQVVTKAWESREAGWLHNPFFQPDFESFVRTGFAKRSGQPGDRAIELTALALERLSRWVKPSTKPVVE